MDDKRDSKELTRRDFIEKGAIGAFLASIVTAAFGVLKLPKPSVFPDPMQKFKIGDPESIAIGEFKEFPGGNLIVFRDREGFYAISKICTHLGCIVNQTKDGFTCPCHGSRFTPEGKVTGGPAPRPLEWLKIELAPDGSLVVDAGNPVKPGAKFSLKG